MEHECCCCFDTYPQDQIAKCNNDHTICKDCINIATKIAVGEMKLFKCPHGDKCDQSIDESIINKFVVDDGLIKAYSNMSIKINIDSIEGLHQCMYCDYAIIVEGELDAFYCEGECKKNYCFKCSEELHEGQRCKEKFHNEAEELTEKHTIKCCGRIIVRYDGCNKLTCNCGKLWCWYCKSAINDYTHFNDPRHGGRKGNCPLYDDPPEPAVIKSDKDKVMEKKQKENQERLERIEQRRLEEERLRQLEIRRREEEQRRQLEMRRREEERLRQLEMVKIKEQKRLKEEEDIRRWMEDYKKGKHRT
jgi:E3 ubiquitin-protein ligase RNF216